MAEHSYRLRLRSRRAFKSRAGAGIRICFRTILAIGGCLRFRGLCATRNRPVSNGSRAPNQKQSTLLATDSAAIRCSASLRTRAVISGSARLIWSAIRWIGGSGAPNVSSILTKGWHTLGCANGLLRRQFRRIVDRFLCWRRYALSRAALHILLG